MLRSNRIEAEVAEAVGALDKAFGGEYFLETLGGDKSLVKPCIKVNLDQALSTSGEIWVAEVNSSSDGLANTRTIVGVAVWRGPKHGPSIP
jgi:hypothetical protein